MSDKDRDILTRNTQSIFNAFMEVIWKSAPANFTDAKKLLPDLTQNAKKQLSQWRAVDFAYINTRAKLVFGRGVESKDQKAWAQSRKLPWADTFNGFFLSWVKNHQTAIQGTTKQPGDVFTPEQMRKTAVVKKQAMDEEGEQESQSKSPAFPSEEYVPSRESGESQSSANLSSLASLGLNIKSWGKGTDPNTLVRHFKDMWDQTKPANLKVAGGGAFTLTGQASGGNTVMNAISNKLRQLRPTGTKGLRQLAKAAINNGDNIVEMLPNYSQGALRTQKGRPVKMQSTVPSKGKLAAVKNLVNKEASLPVTMGLAAPILEMANQALVAAGYNSYGPMTKNGLPYYLGRTYNQKTNRIESLPRPNFYVDPTNWNAKLQKNLYTMAYKWNQFVRSQQTVVNHMKKKPNWAFQVSKWTKNHSYPQLKRKVMMGIYRGILAGTFMPFKVMNNDLRVQLAAKLKAWDFDGVVEFIQSVAKVATNGENFKTFDKLTQKRWLDFVTFGETIKKRFLRSQAQTQLGQNMGTRTDVQKWTADYLKLPWTQEQAKKPMASYFGERKSRKGQKKKTQVEWDDLMKVVQKGQKKGVKGGRVNLAGLRTRSQRRDIPLDISALTKQAILGKAVTEPSYSPARQQQQSQDIGNPGSMSNSDYRWENALMGLA